MASVKDISEPVKVYKEAKEAFHQNVEEYFNNLLKDSHVDEANNKAICDSYYKKLDEINNANKMTKKKKTAKGWLTFLMVLCFITIVLIPFGILIKKKIKKIELEIEDMNKTINRLTKESNDIKNEAERQAAPLNSLYDWNIAPRLFTKTLPLIETDSRFEVNRLQYLIEKYGFKEHQGHDVSTLFVQSGTILGNPFIIEQNYVEEMRPYVYTGTLVIHYVTYESDSDGHTHAVHHTETLVAHLTKPRPYYFKETWLVYGNAAAPKLTFSRGPNKLSKEDDKSLNRAIAKNEKKLERVSKKDITFTKMGNSKFEALFNAINRDNEVEFRLLFTPLAQANMINLLRMKEPYGDDFIFAKEHELNYIKSNHAQCFDYSSNPTKFIDFDVAKARESFIKYCDDYFNNLYFDLAPLLTIPLYQNHKAQEFIYKDNQKSRHTSFEVESLVNHMDKDTFKHKDSVTDVILKTNFVKRNNDIDMMDVTAYSFRSIPHVEMVPTLGGDGSMHMVPVHWDEYIEISKVTPIVVKKAEDTRASHIANKNDSINGIKNVYYQKGIVSAILNLNKEK